MKVNLINIALVLLICLVSCPMEAQKKIKHKLYKTYWYEVDYNGIKEAWSKDKKVLIPQSVGCTEIVYKDNEFRVKTKDGFVGIFNGITGKAIIEPNQYTAMDYHTYYTYKVKSQEGKVGLVSRTGRIIFPLSDYDDIKECNYAYVRVTKGGKEGVCDTLGNEIIVPRWESINGPRITNGVSYYTVEDDFRYILDDEGNIIYVDKTGQYTDIDYWCYKDYQFVIARKGDKHEILDIKGKVIISMNRYDTSEPKIEKGHPYFIVKKNGLSGICNVNGLEIIPPRYKSVFYSDRNNEFELEDINRSRHYIDSGVSLNCDFDFGIPSPILETIESSDNLSVSSALAVTISQVGSKYRLDDRFGNPLTKKLYDALVYDDSEKVYYGQLNGYTTVIKEDGQEQNPIGKQIFDEAYSLDGEYAQDKLDLYFLLLKTDPNNLDGYNASAYNNIGVIFSNAGDDDQALVYYEKALAIDPSNQTAKGNIKAIKAERRTQRLNNIANALGQMSEALGSMNAALGGGSYGSYLGSGSSSYTGSSSKTRVQRHCTNCAGTGNCPKCRGNGRILGKFDQEFHCCPICNYNCSAPKEKKGKCTRCGGTGVR